MTEEIKKQVVEEIYDYLKENIEDFELEAQLALFMEEWLHNVIETDELLSVEKKYRITCKTDPYHASRCARYKGREILEWNGATPVKWVHDDYFGLGYTLKEVRQALMSFAYEDAERTGEKIRHKYFSMYYESDVFTYAAEEF